MERNFRFTAASKTTHEKALQQIEHYQENVQSSPNLSADTYGCVSVNLELVVSSR